MRLYKYLLSILICFLCRLEVHALDDIQIELEQPTFVMPRFTGPFRKREVSIAPEEYEMAEELRGLLDQGENDLVLKKLNEFYDIELSPAMLMLKGQLYFHLEEYTHAEDVYKMVIERMPQLVRAHIDLGQLYLVIDKPEEARNHFALAISYGANDAIVYGQLGYFKSSVPSSMECHKCLPKCFSH